MKLLMIGGTGNISMSVSHWALTHGIDLFLVNRGRSAATPEGARLITADIRDRDQLQHAMGDQHFDCIVNWIAFEPADVQQDIDLFNDRCRQYIFISTASGYQKPATDHLICEHTPMANPFWDYSQKKIDCENLLMQAHRDTGFPVTIVRPSHTYRTKLPVAVGPRDYTFIHRLQQGKPIVAHGDGNSLWTLTHADDFAEGFGPLIGHPQTIGQSYHITGDQVLTWRQIYHTIANAVGVEPTILCIPSELIARQMPALAGNLLGDKAHNAIFDNRKIKRIAPQLTQRIPLHLGVQKVIDYFHADPARSRPDPQADAKLDQLVQWWQQKIS